MNIGIMVRTINEHQGIGIYTLNLLDNLLRLDMRNNYYLIYKDEYYWDRYDKYPNVHKVLLNLPSKLLWDQVGIPYLIKKLKLDLIFNTKFTVPLLTKCPSVMVMHGSEWYVYPKHYSLIDVLYIHLFMFMYVRKATRIISVSDRAKFDISEFTNVNPDKFRTIYLAYNERFRKIDDISKLNSVKLKYDLPEKFIVFVGMIYPGKNVGNLLRAFNEIKDKIPHNLLLVGGFRWKYEHDIKLIKEFNLEERVRIINWIDHDELPVIYNLAEVFAFPSWYESCPAPPWEAMACGCPVVTSNTGGTPEVTGDAVMYVDPNDTNSIASGLLKVIQNKELRNDLIQKGYYQIKKFSWEKTALQTLLLFTEINNKITELSDYLPLQS